MKTAASLSSFLLGVALPLGAQNLVPNASFEIFTQCPTSLGQIDYALGWYYPFMTSPDYFNACASLADQTGVPQNSAGYQTPLSGLGYAGLITYLDASVAPESNFRKEVMAIELATPLQPGVITSLSFAISPTGDGDQLGNRARLTTQGIGLRFSMVADYDPFAGLPNEAALYLSTIPWDTVAWLTVAGSFTPDSAYEYLKGSSKNLLRS